MHKIELLASGVGVLLFVAVFELIRRKKVMIKYSILWFSTVLVTEALAIRSDWLEAVAKFSGIYYPPSALFLIFNLFLVLILIHFSMVITELKEQVRSLAQQSSLQDERIRKLSENSAEKRLSSKDSGKAA